MFNNVIVFQNIFWSPKLHILESKASALGVFGDVFGVQSFSFGRFWRRFLESKASALEFGVNKF